MRRLDPTTWKRKHHYSFFRDQTFPYLSLTARVSIHGLMQARGKNGRSPFSLFLFCVTKAANEVPQLRQRIRPEPLPETVVEHASVDPAFVVEVEGELFNYATVTASDDIDQFCSDIRAVSKAHRTDPVLAPFDGQRDNLIYTTCIPWLDFSQITHPVDTRQVDSVPRIAWGKFAPDGTVSVGLQAHHALVDGRHVSQFFERLEQQLQSL
jgi:chloramphenicol O-acetyltransferase type A